MLERILEEIDAKLSGSMGRKREGLLEADKIIRKYMNGGWIPVEERLPEPYQQVLVSMYNNLSYVTIGHYGGYEKKWHTKEWITDLGVDVKAWRPLPEPYHPKKGESE